jgi:hypothetical protein
MKHSNGILGGGDFYQGRMAVIKGSGFVNSRDLSARQTSFKAVRKSFIRQFNS